MLALIFDIKIWAYSAFMENFLHQSTMAILTTGSTPFWSGAVFWVLPKEHFGLEGGVRTAGVD